ncbi:MAG: DUF1467 family protein [Roseovarius sp.]|nr:DUF1467 family protein [Roseovarius sp.]MCY4207966.1 DUF1467 family protein [Roseovarius sp.]MCY4292013.1 DUF1467 family protein [Roseovarius sp.]MCY4316315.1 DUF1467 family protein [Roseovarius sp.]
MGIAGGIVLYMIILLLVFMVALPLKITTQGEAGKKVPGTHESSPERHHLRIKFIIAIAVALVLWAVAAAIIQFELISIYDIGIYSYME